MERSDVSARMPRRRDHLAPLPPSGVTAMNDAVDPVCKMTVDVDKAMWRSTYRGKEYFFCAKGCKDAFDRDPEKFL